MIFSAGLACTSAPAHVHPVPERKLGAAVSDTALPCRCPACSLAMVAFMSFVFQHAATGKGPVAALAEHLANPFGANCGTNGVSIPF